MKPKTIFLLGFSIIMVLTIGRLIKGNFDASYFIVAGNDFADSSKISSPIHIKNGQGYDGQFFYRYSLNPFNFQKSAYGITVDVVPYRIQRLVYPLAVWLLSFGGVTQLVPWMMILVNLLAFLGILFYFNKFIVLTNGNPNYGILPIFLCGIYMSFSRDLSEVVELFFFTGAIFYLFKSKYFYYSIFSTIAILTRDTSIIVLLPLALCLTYKLKKSNFKIKSLFYLFNPFMVFAIWKIIILMNIPSFTPTEGYQKMGLPLVGIIDGFIYNFDFSDTKHFLQFIFWMAYLIWNSWLFVIVIRLIPFNSLFLLDKNCMLSVIYLVWFLFSLIITLTIYIDDWGFVRIFSLWNMIGFMIIIVNKYKISRLFITSSAILVFITIARLIVRV